MLVSARRRRIDTGADSFIAFYGIKIAIDPADEQMREALDSRSGPRCKAAKRAGLQTHWGRLTDGKDYFLYIGHRIGWLGVENDGHVQVPTDKLAVAAQATKPAGQDPTGLQYPVEATTLPLCPGRNASPFSIILLLVSSPTCP
jgi:hypothetical protein